MFTGLRHNAAFVLLKLTLFAKRNYILNEFLTIAGLAPLIVRLRDYYTRNINEIYFEADLYGTKIKFIDGTVRHEYYDEALKGGMHEPALVRMLNKLLSGNEPVTFVDIGAHIGYFTVYAGNLLGKRGNVISIEPNPDYHRQLLKNIELNRLHENTRTFQIGFSNKIGKAKVGGWEDRDLFESEMGNVDLMTFDQLCKSTGIKPDIIKIDVHGAEYIVLSGMIDTLENHVKHLFVETHSEELMQGYDIPAVINLIDSVKFELFKLNDFRNSMSDEIVPIDDDLHADMMIYVRRRCRN